MFKLRSTVRNAFVLLFLVAMFASSASATGFQLTNGPIVFAGPSGTVGTIPNFGVSFSDIQLSGSGSTQYISLGIPDTVVGTLDFNGIWNMTLVGPDPLEFAQIGTSNIFKQLANTTLLLSYDGGAATIGITNSTIELTSGVLTKWTIPGATPAQTDPGCFLPNPPAVCSGGSTWTFYDIDGNPSAKNTTDMVLTPVDVPEPASLFLMALGLGAVARFVRKPR